RRGESTDRPQLPVHRSAGPLHVTPHSVAGVEAGTGRSEGPRRSGALRRLLSRRIAVVGGLLLCVVVLLGLLAPLLTPYGPNDLSISNRLQPSSADHPFGTDNLGRDVWTRTLFGTRLSLLVGI